MKKRTFFVIGVIFFSGLLSMQAKAPQKQSSPTTWYIFTGNDANLGEVLDPFYYQQYPGTPPNKTPNLHLDAIKVDYFTEVYPSGYPEAGLPKVDWGSTALQNDILDATGRDAFGTINEIPNRVTLRATIYP